MNKIWVGTNWKMHKSLREGIVYTKELMEVVEHLNEDIKVFIIPPHTALWPIKEVVGSSRLQLGAQNMHWEEEGAYTGEISPMMLTEIELDLVELGHSERRQYYNENDEDINKKVLAALKHGLKPLICIGENLEQKTFGITEEVIAAQLKVTLSEMTKEQAAEVLIAYEPVWAIGAAGKPAEADYVARIHDHIRRTLVSLFGITGENTPILYGGSVNQTNFMSYLENKNVNGLFIGRAAWDMSSFKEILTTIHNYKSLMVKN